MRRLIAGNWKMNGLGADLAEIAALTRALAATPRGMDVLICPPATLISRARAVVADSAVALGGQDCASQASGAFTGDISAEMLRDAGASFVILGHSERRHIHGESDATVHAKVQAARRADLCAILCVGETRAERDAGKATTVVQTQLAASLPDGATPADTVIAYEPVWAIGTGLVPKESEISEMHALIRRALRARFGDAGGEFRILYGGSMNAANAAVLLALPEVAGGLIGGASLTAADLLGIIAAAPQAGSNVS